MTREELLEQLSEYVDLDTGRKIRTDKGMVRGAYGKRTKEESAMSIYNRVKARLTNKDQMERRDGSYLLEGFDENGYYIPVPAAYKDVAKEYKQNTSGRMIEHSLRRVRTQKEVDLEKYRFNALKEYAINVHLRDRLIEPTPDIRGLFMSRGYIDILSDNETLKNFISTNHITYREWFAFVYHVNINDIYEWTYETWLEHYKCCGGQYLDDNIEFNLNYKPGSAEWLPEFNATRLNYEQNKDREVKSEIERKSVQFIANMKRR